jgi:carbamoyltransferase
MNIIGLNGSMNLVHENRTSSEEHTQHDAGAAILMDGHIVAAFEEERLNRIKHTNKFPRLAIQSCLSYCGGDFDQIDAIAISIGEKTISKNLSLYSQLLGVHIESARHFIQVLFQQYLDTEIDPGKIELFDHHFAHAVSAFYPSGYDSALVLTIDGFGDDLSGSVSLGRGNELEQLKTFSFEKSLGQFYTLVTLQIGFNHFDEYKVMGLAPYGDPSVYRSLFRQFYELLPCGEYVLHTQKISQLDDLLGKKGGGSGFGKTHMDIAAALQEALEAIVFHVVRYFRDLTKSSRICIAGGVGLNCTLNGKLVTSGLFDDVFIYPACGDSGLPIGSALAAYFKRCKDPRKAPMKNFYLGRGIGEADEIEKELCKWSSIISFKRVENVAAVAAALLADDKVIGWVQGRSEFAPRALGNRSILADPRPARNKERINAIVKKREAFRPFAPSVMEEYAGDYFQLPDNKTSFPHMIYTLMVKPEFKDQLGAVIHVDGSARVQTVSSADNIRYWRLIDHFRKLTDVPIVLNTSFNNNAEPIVDTVNDAIVSFLTTNLDHLIVGDYLIDKNGSDLQALGDLYPSFGAFMKISKNESYHYGPEQGHVTEIRLSNTFNRKTYSLSEGLYRTLIKVNGQRSIHCLIKDLSAPEQAELLRQINELWEKRWIRLHPQPCQKDVFSKNRKDK